MGRVVKNSKGLDNLRKAGHALDGIIAKVGYFETSKYPDGTPVAAVASVHEFGSPSKGIPARPTMRPTIAEQRPTWARHLAQGAQAVVEGRFTAEQVMDSVGALAAGDVRKSIAALQSPPLKPETIKARQRRYADKKTVGSLGKPLVDTAIMVNSVTHVVEAKGSGGTTGEVIG